MSWGTCYSASNNIHFDFPPIMKDGRNFANWQPGAVISEQIRKDNNITSNYDYRKYMIENADNIIKLNQLEAVGECTGSVGRYDTGSAVSTNSPYVFKSVSDNSQHNAYGYEQSDLKNMYLSRAELQARLVTPVITQSELLKQSFARDN